MNHANRRHDAAEREQHPRGLVDTNYDVRDPCREAGEHERDTDKEGAGHGLFGRAGRARGLARVEVGIVVQAEH